MANIFCINLDLDLDPDFQYPAIYGRDPYRCKNKGHRSVSLKDIWKTDGLADTTDRLIAR